MTRRSRDWSKEFWIKQHVREPLDELLAPLMQRALRDYLRKRAEADGSLVVDRDDPLGALTRALGAHEPELGLARQALNALLQEGILESDGRSIWMPERVESQVRTPVIDAAEITQTVAEPRAKPTSTSRVRAHRERKRNASAELKGVSPPVSGVSAGVSLAVSPGVSHDVPVSRGDHQLDPFRSLGDQKDQEDQKDHLRLGDHVHASSGVSPSVATGVSSADDDDDDRDAHSQAKGESARECAVPSGAREPECRSLAEALQLGVIERSGLLVDRPELADALRPDLWPEVRALADAFASARGRQTQPLGRYAHDSAVRQAIALYAAGYSPTDVVHVVRAVARQEWAKDRALASLLTFKVLDANRPKPLVKTEASLSPRAAAALARARGSQHREVG